MAGIFYVLTSSPVVEVVAYRMLFATILIAPLAAVRQARSRPSQAPAERTDSRDSMYIAFAGLLFAVDLMLWAASLRFTSVASAALFVSTHPMFVALLAAAIFHEVPTRLIVAGIALGIFGIIIVGAHDVHLSGRALIGDGLALLAAFAETGYLLVGRHVRKRVDAPRYAFGVYAWCAALVWFAVACGGVPIALSLHDLLLALGLAGIATAGGHTLVSLSLGYMPAAVVAVSFLAQPLLAAVFALAFVHQTIAASTVVGGIVALLGIVLVAYGNEQKASAMSAA